MPEYSPHMDRRQELSGGSHSSGTTTWTLSYGDAAINCLILGPGANVGQVFTPTVNSSTYPFTVSVTGNYASITAVVGVVFDWVVTLADPVRLRRDGSPDFISRVQLRGVECAYHESGGFTVRRTMTGRANSERTFAGNSDGSVTASGLFRANLGGNTSDADWSLRSSSPKRVVIPSVEHLVDITNRRDG